MRRTTIFACGAALALFATVAHGQKTPGKDFDGKWTRVTDPNAPPPGGRGGGRGGLGMEASIKVEDMKFIITRTTQAGETKTVYNLDGTESKNTMTMGGNSVEQTSKTMWMADTLMITTKMNMGENTSTSTMSLWIDKAGNLMVSSTSPGRGGGEPTKTVSTYKKG